MARIAVVAYPTVDQQTLDWIDSIRVRHDPQARRIPPHFTLVFPVEESPGEITEEIARVPPASADPVRHSIGDFDA